MVAATRRRRGPLQGKQRIELRVGRVLNRHKLGKHFQLEITEEGFTYRRKERRIAQAAALDGFT